MHRLNQRFINNALLLDWPLCTRLATFRSREHDSLEKLLQCGRFVLGYMLCCPFAFVIITVIRTDDSCSPDLIWRVFEPEIKFNSPCYTLAHQHIWKRNVAIKFSMFRWCYLFGWWRWYSWCVYDTMQFVHNWFTIICEHRTQFESFKTFDHTIQTQKCDAR